MASIPTTVSLDQYQTNTLLELKTRGAGTYATKMSIQGNSILSSIFVKSMAAGASVKVNYYDTTSGTELLGERYDLTGHDLLSGVTSPTTNRVTVTKIHNKPIVEVIVTGGDVEFGLYVTVVSSFATDLDDSLIRDGDTFYPLDSRAIPMACLNETSNTLEFVRCPFPVSVVDGEISVSEEGDPFHVAYEGTSNPGNAITLGTFTVPAGTTRKAATVNFSSPATGCWRVESNGNLLASGIIAPGDHNSSFKFEPKQPIAPSSVVTLKFTQVSDQSALPVEAYFMASDVSS